MQDFISCLLWSIVAMFSQFLLSACRKKWACFNQSEVHLQSFNLKLICMVSAYLKFIFKASISDVYLQIKLQFICISGLLSAVNLHGFQTKRKLARIKCQVDDFSEDFHSGASSKKFLTFYSHAWRWKNFLSFRFNEFWCTYACSWKHFILNLVISILKKKKITWTGVSGQSMHLVKRQKNPL